MRLDRLKSFALSLPQTTWVKQWGECLVYKVGGKMFLIIVMDGETVEATVFKCTPEEFDELTANDGVTQAPYCAKRHWVRAVDDALTETQLQESIRESYKLVFGKLPKKTQAALSVQPRSSP